MTMLVSNVYPQTLTAINALHWFTWDYGWLAAGLVFFHEDLLHHCCWKYKWFPISSFPLKSKAWNTNDQLTSDWQMGGTKPACCRLHCCRLQQCNNNLTSSGYMSSTIRKKHQRSYVCMLCVHCIIEQDAWETWICLGLNKFDVNTSLIGSCPALYNTLPTVTNSTIQRSSFF